MLCVGNSVIDIKEASDEERQLDLGSDECILSLTRFAEMCHGFGALASLEINHNGKDSDPGKTGKPAYSPSSIIPVPRAVAGEAAGQGDAPDHRDGPGQDQRDRREVRHRRPTLQEGGLQDVA